MEYHNTEPDTGLWGAKQLCMGGNYLNRIKYDIPENNTATTVIAKIPFRKPIK